MLADGPRVGVRELGGDVPASLGCADLGADMHSVDSMLSVLAPEQADRLHNVVEGDAEEQLAVFVENVRKALQR